jgi:uncharacterized protein DUF1579
MTNSEAAMPDDSHPALHRLETLVGRWRTEGSTRAASGRPGARIEAVDTYERVAGGALLHLVDARVGDEKVDGAELVGYDPARRTYVTQYFGSDGPAAYEAGLDEQDGILTWTMRSDTTRFTGTFSEDAKVITGFWELLEDGSGWEPWMDITLTKLP